MVLVGTLDTKGHEYAFLRDRIRTLGVEVLLVDAGILGEPLVWPRRVPRGVRVVAGGGSGASRHRAIVAR